jgi:uncharacterized protein YndB with AHSA1/START domain
MTEAQTASSEVEVAVDPATAFTAFTDEMDLWWVRGPINFSATAGGLWKSGVSLAWAGGSSRSWTTLPLG